MSENFRERMEHLKSVSIFADVKDNHEAMETLAKSLQERTFQPGQAIITEGESGSEMFLLVKGAASVFKTTTEGDHYKVAILTGDQNAGFGEGGLLGGDARSATIKADTPCQCWVLDRTTFESFGNRYPQWALPIVYRITHSMMARLKKANNDLMLLYNALVAEIRGH